MYFCLKPASNRLVSLTITCLGNRNNFKISPVTTESGLGSFFRLILFLMTAATSLTKLVWVLNVIVLILPNLGHRLDFHYVWMCFLSNTFALCHFHLSFELLAGIVQSSLTFLLLPFRNILFSIISFPI